MDRRTAAKMSAVGRDPVGDVIREISLIAACTEQAEWNGHVVYLPL